MKTESILSSSLRTTSRVVWLSQSRGEPRQVISYLNIKLDLSMQQDPIVSKASELLRLGLMPSAQEIKNGKVRASMKVLRTHMDMD